LKTPRILLPFGAGAMSAYGLLAAPLAFDFVRTGRQRLDGADWASINRRFAEMEAEGRALLARAGVAARDIAVARIAEMRYLGQGHEVEAAVPLGTLAAGSLPAITASFEGAYRALYHRLPQGVPIEALNWRVTVSGPAFVPGATSASGRRPAPRAAQLKGRRPRIDPIKGTRRAYFAEREGFVATPVYDRYALTPGLTLKGPAIVEERESTAVIGPGGRARVDAGLGLVVEMPR
jgi:N-methylhydantoinase A/oxoprolinase/acetone carboxylase beta subunit